MSLELAPTEVPAARPASFHIVGIGASAGGLEALEAFFQHMPQNTGMAFVVVQHLSPDFKSMMNELLARHTDIPIHQVTDGMLVAPDSIYLIPPRKEMIISGGRLLLSERDPSKEVALPIDLFFRSLAQDAGSRAVAVILSGSGSDGSRGIRDIHEAGGFVVSQAANTAKFDGMPKSARDTGVVDVVASPEEIPGLLIAHQRSEMPPVQGRGLDLAPERSGLGAVFASLEREFGIDFSHYKPSTVSRRIERRLHLNRIAGLDEYIRMLQESADERNALYKDLLIGVTKFFRDPESFEILEDHIFPELLSKLGRSDELRIWVAGCATGEEAYSITIVALEQLSRMADPPMLKVFATDVHRASLDIASLGVYGEEAVAGISQERLARFFSRHGNSEYRVSQEVRQHVVFASHNVIRDAPFTKVHLVSCRNLLIYLQPHAQKKVLSLFHFALKRGGVLFLGPSETPGAFTDDFEVIDEHARMFRKHRDMRLSSEVRLPLPRPSGLRAGPFTSSMPLGHVMGTYDALLEEYLPPSLLITERRELVHAFRGAGKYLRVKDGRPTLDLLDMLDPELKMALTGAIQRALKDSQPVVYKGVRVTSDDGERVLKVSVKPILNRVASTRHLLISFESGADEQTTAATEKEIDLGEVSSEQLGALEAELRYTKENLQATIEELETSNEELQATNEELVASNEELQSTNEELQSVNEELYTVNAEYQKKIAELTELTNDMDNLLSSTEVGTIFLDRDLCIRKFTPRIESTFNLLPRDLGRRIDVFTNTIAQPLLLDDLARVRDTGQVVEREVRDRNGAWYYLRILPYKANGEIRGVVITLIDISSLKHAEDALFAERYLLGSLMETLPDCIYFKDGEGRYVRINSAMARRLGLSGPSGAIGRTAADFFPQAVAEQERAEEEEIRRTGEGRPEKEEQNRLADGTEKWFVTTRMPLRDREGRIVGTFGVARDITERRRSEEEIREAVRRRDQFLAMLSHELRNPLGAIVSAGDVLKHAGGERAAGRDRALVTIERQSRQMGRLLDDLLDVSRVTQNKIELDRQIVDLRTIVQEALEVVRGKLEGRHLHVDVGTEPAWVLGDPARLQQIHVNLLNNAAKFSRPGGNVWVSFAVEGDEVVTRVRDDGVGIPKEMLDKIFELFVQSENTLDRSEAGMGVGLTLVRSLVEMHGGSVRATSAGPGRGAELVVTLPKSREAPKKKKRLELRLQGRGDRVVLVEDNEDSREMMGIILQSMGFEIHEAPNGSLGIELIKKVHPKVALVDIGLPVVNGYQVASAVRAEPSLHDVYLVALTGYGQPSDAERALEAGFDEHLVKPLSLERLTRLFTGAQS